MELRLSTLLQPGYTTWLLQLVETCKARCSSSWGDRCNVESVSLIPWCAPISYESENSGCDMLQLIEAFIPIQRDEWLFLLHDNVGTKFCLLVTELPLWKWRSLSHSDDGSFSYSGPFYHRSCSISSEGRRPLHLRQEDSLSPRHGSSDLEEWAPEWDSPGFQHKS